MLVVGAVDRRVKCVVAQVPLISGDANARRLIRADLIAPTRQMFEADREARYRGEPPAMIPVVAEEGSPCALPTGGLLRVVHRDRPAHRAVVAQRGHAAQRRDVHRVRARRLHLPGSRPTPLLMVVAAGDHLTVSDLAIAAYEKAREPKRLEILPGMHFEAYTKDFEHAGGAARDWFAEHLLGQVLVLTTA